MRRTTVDVRPCAVQVSVDDQQACYERNGYPTKNVTNCCNAGFNKFKFYPSRSRGREGSHGVGGGDQLRSTPESLPQKVKAVVWRGARGRDESQGWEEEGRGRVGGWIVGG